MSARKSDTPGLAWRRYRPDYKAAYWICRHDISKSGYPIKARRLWSGDVPTEQEMAAIGAQCRQLQHEMLDWQWKPKARKSRRLNPDAGFVYFIRVGELIKIGFATKLEKRLSNLQSGSPYQLELVGSMPGSPLLERQIQHRFASLRNRGEWFRAEPRLLTFIERTKSEDVHHGDFEFNE